MGGSWREARQGITPRSSAGLRQTARPEKVNSFCLEGHQPLIRSREQGGKELGDES